MKFKRVVISKTLTALILKEREKYKSRKNNNKLHLPKLMFKKILIIWCILLLNLSLGLEDLLKEELLKLKMIRCIRNYSTRSLNDSK